MTIPLYIPFLNRPDLLDLAVRSAYKSGVDATIINNSSDDNTKGSCDWLTIIRPPVPLTFAQSQNWMLRMAEDRQAPFYLFCHSDAEAGEGTVQKLIELAQSLTNEGRKWGVIFTNYDALAAFNTEAFREVGGWDTELSWYHSDIDMYRRLELAGYELVKSNLPVKHKASQTLNSDQAIKRNVDLMFPCRVAYYKAKWGGDAGSETYSVPFDGKAY
jgi:GT2 family glycosyltransferase